MQMKIVVAAVPGSGKTTVLKFVQKKIPSARIISEGDIIFESASKKFGIKNRDELRKKLTIGQQRILQDAAIRKIAAMKNKILLIDSHLSIETPEGYLPGLPEKAVRTIKPDVIVILEFNPTDVLKRRKKDRGRKRDIEALRKITEQQNANREFAFAAAMAVQAAVEIIEFPRKQIIPFSHAKLAARKIVGIVKKLEKN
jgi:adenylate kinase